MKRGAIFDMDGTLFDTEKLYRKAWLDVAEEFGLEKKPALPSAVSGSSLGEGCIRVVRQFYPEATDIAADYFNRVLEVVGIWREQNLELMAGVEEILGYFKSVGVVMAVASAATVDEVDKNLRRANLRGYFDVIVGGDMVTNGKPAPDIFLLAAEKLNLPASDCYIFEDSLNGIRAAHASGGVAVMIPDQVQPTDDVKKICAAIFPNLSEAKQSIERDEL